MPSDETGIINNHCFEDIWWSNYTIGKYVNADERYLKKVLEKGERCAGNALD
jgi:hypothetical protein